MGSGRPQVFCDAYTLWSCFSCNRTDFRESPLLSVLYHLVASGALSLHTFLPVFSIFGFIIRMSLVDFHRSRSSFLSSRALNRFLKHFVFDLTSAFIVPSGIPSGPGAFLYFILFRIGEGFDIFIPYFLMVYWMCIAFLPLDKSFLEDSGFLFGCSKYFTTHNILINVLNTLYVIYTTAASFEGAGML